MIVPKMSLINFSQDVSDSTRDGKLEKKNLKDIFHDKL
jgi:hypothetical protein